MTDHWWIRLKYDNLCSAILFKQQQQQVISHISLQILPDKILLPLRQSRWTNCTNQSPTWMKKLATRSSSVPMLYGTHVYHPDCVEVSAPEDITLWPFRQSAASLIQRCHFQPAIQTLCNDSVPDTFMAWNNVWQQFILINFSKLILIGNIIKYLVSITFTFDHNTCV